jgi:hypothetical protein
MKYQIQQPPRTATLRLLSRDPEPLAYDQDLLLTPLRSY